MQRRTFLKSAGTGAAAAAAVGPAYGAETGAKAAMEKPEDLTALRRQPLINREQAQRVMEQHDLAGLIALNPVNVYYLTNTIPIGVKMRWEYPAFATYPRDAKQPAFLVSTVAQLWDVANGDRWVPDVIPYSGPENWAEFAGEQSKPPTTQPQARRFGYAVDETAELRPREKGWSDSQKNYQPSPTPEWALARALKESGIVKGRVAVDDMRAAHLLDGIGRKGDLEWVDGDNIFRHIRFRKSPAELDYIRITARNNAEAALATARSISEGMTFDDIERRFLMETAARGNDMTFVLAGMSLGLLPTGRVEEGEPILLDAVSSFAQYHGDFARTVVVGEPRKAVQRRCDALAEAREATRAFLRPGVKYSEIRKVGFDAFKKAGGDPSTLIVNPHSVGLQHTDQPYRDDTPWRVGDDLTVEKDTVLTIDLPFIEVGFGAGHNEDLLLVTDSGHELLNTDESPLIVV